MSRKSVNLDIRVALRKLKELIRINIFTSFIKMNIINNCR